MVGRFTARRATTSEPLPTEEPTALEGVSWTVFPETGGEQGAAAPQTESPLLSDKLLDAKVRLHRRLIEEINLSALDKVPEEEIRRHVQQLVSQYVLVERLPLNTQELSDFVSEILDEMTGLGPLEPLLKDPTINDILINGMSAFMWNGPACLSRCRCGSRTSITCCASSTRSCPRSDAASMNRIRSATRACRMARASTSRFGRSVSTVRWSQSVNSPRSRSTSPNWSMSALCAPRWRSCLRLQSSRASPRSSPAAPAPVRPRCSMRCPHSSRKKSAC